jgi:hypothetical protein
VTENAKQDWVVGAVGSLEWLPLWGREKDKTQRPANAKAENWCSQSPKRLNMVGVMTGKFAMQSQALIITLPLPHFLFCFLFFIFLDNMSYL